MNTNRRHSLHPTLRLTALLCIASLLSGMTEAYASLPDGENNLRPGTALSTHKSGWVCAVVLDEQVPVPGQEYEGYFLYGNQGRQAIDIPYVHLDAGEKTSLRFTKADGWSDQLELMAVSGDGAASRLEPGETQRIPFFYKTEGDAASVRMGYTLDDPSEFNWEAAEPWMRPTWAGDELWGISLAILKGNVGKTWNDYLSRMRANCDHLAEIGRPAWRLDQVWQMEVDAAMGVDHALPSLASNQDLVRPGRGGGLVLSRTYGTGLTQRFRKGPLGYGWSFDYDMQAELDDSGGTLSLNVEGEKIPLFAKKDGKWVPDNSSDGSTLEETETEYVLTLESGMVLRIAKSNMRVSSHADKAGIEMAYEYDGDGRLAKVQHGDGQWLAFSYRDGLLVDARDDQGRQVRYEYNGEMLAKVTAFDGQETRYRYLPADGSATSRALRQIVYADGTTRDFTYDAEGRVVTVAVNGTELQVEIVRRAYGSYAVVGPDGGTTEVTLGALGEVLETVDALGRRSKSAYTAEGLLESVTGPTGKRAEIAYDGAGRAVRAVDAGGAEMAFTYAEESGRLERLTDARGNGFTYGFDALGRGESIGYADGSVERIRYDGRGDVVESVNRRGQRIEYEHDEEGRVVSKRWEDGRTFTWAYDSRGNCTNAMDSVTGAVSMEYDGNDRLVRIVYPKGRGFAYEYDGLGRLVSRTTLGGTGSFPSAIDIQRYSYDSLGRLATMTDGDGHLWLENTYDAAMGLPVRQTYGNGTVASNEFDRLGRTTCITHFSKDGRVLEQFAYEYDADGRCVRQMTREGVERYTHDAVGQLTGVVYPDGTEEHFTYDAVGNRVTAGRWDGMVASYDVNELNQYTRAGGMSFRYDTDGNLVEKTAPGGGTTRYYYDVENRLVGVTNGTRNIAWSCEYDVFGNRTRVVDHGVVRETLFERGGLPSAVAEFDVEGTVVGRHVVAGEMRVADVGKGTRYVHMDGLGSARLATDASGRVAERASFRVFGGVRRLEAAAAEGGFPPSVGWVGALGVEQDEATGLIFMRNRYYDAETGRFIQMDPIRHLAGDVNLYRYCANGAVDGVDPTGTFCGIGPIGPKTPHGDGWHKQMDKWCKVVYGDNYRWNGKKCVDDNGKPPPGGGLVSIFQSVIREQSSGPNIGYNAMVSIARAMTAMAIQLENVVSSFVSSLVSWVGKNPYILATIGGLVEIAKFSRESLGMLALRARTALFFLILFPLQFQMPEAEQDVLYET